jgi:hypothetical protein
MLLYKKTQKFLVGGPLGYNNQIADSFKIGSAPFPGVKTDYGNMFGSMAKKSFDPISASTNISKGLLYDNKANTFRANTSGLTPNTAVLPTSSLPEIGELPKSSLGDLDGAKASKYAGATAAGVGLVSGALTANTYEGTKDPTKYTRADRKNDMKKNTAKGLAAGASIGGAVGASLGTAAATSVASTIGLGATAGAATLAAGVAVPLIGAVVVGLGFAIASMLGRKKKRRQAQQNSRDQIASLNSQQRAQRRNDLQTGYDTSVNAPAPTLYGAGQPSQGSYGVARKGGVLLYNKSAAPRKYKKGGVVKEHENIIPNGVLHEEENSLGDKGMPVVKCVNDVCTKKYEIEKDEMILTLDTTKRVETLARNKNHKGLGEFVKEQILDNTHSFTPKYSDLNSN